MKTRFLMILFLSLAPVLLAQAGFSSHSDRQAKFSIKYPSDWTMAQNQDNVNFIVKSPDETAQVQVLVSDLGEEDISPVDFLSSVEQSMGVTNLLPEKKRIPPASQIKAAGGESGAMGAYKIEGEVVVLQGISVMKKGNKIYTLIQTIAEIKKSEYGKPIGDIAKSFRITK